MQQQLDPNECNQFIESKTLSFPLPISWVLIVKYLLFMSISSQRLDLSWTSVAKLTSKKKKSKPKRSENECNGIMSGCKCEQSCIKYCICKLFLFRERPNIMRKRSIVTNKSRRASARNGDDKFKRPIRNKLNEKNCDAWIANRKRRTGWGAKECTAREKSSREWKTKRAKKANERWVVSVAAWMVSREANNKKKWRNAPELK